MYKIIPWSYRASVISYKKTNFYIMFWYKWWEASFLLCVTGSCKYALIHPTVIVWVEKWMATLCLYGILIDCCALWLWHWRGTRVIAGHVGQTVRFVTISAALTACEWKKRSCPIGVGIIGHTQWEWSPVFLSRWSIDADIKTKTTLEVSIKALFHCS